MTISLEEASKCPKCGVAAKLTTAYKNHSFEKNEWWDLCVYVCDRKVCLNYNEPWLVQSNKNGIVFERNIGDRGMDKTFEPMSKDQLAFGRMIVEDALGKEHNK